MSENISENTVVTPAEQPVEITEITREGLLPDSRLIPMKCGWAAKQMLTYNRDALNPPQTLTRLRERDCFVFGNERVMVSIAILDYGYCGAVCVSLVDCPEARERSQTKLIPFSMGSIILPVSSSTGDVVFRSEDVSLDFLRAPDKWYIRLYFDRFDDVRSLYVNVCVEDVGGDSAFCSMPAGKRGNRFLLRHGLYGMPASGKVVLGADVYELDAADTMGWLERERADGGRVEEHSRISLCGLCGDTTFGLCAAEKGVFTAENTLIVNGRASRLDDLSIQREDGVWYLSTPDGRIQLYMPVIASRTDCVKLLAVRTDRHREYGLCFGEMTLFGQRHTITSAMGCGESTDWK